MVTTDDVDTILTVEDMADHLQKDLERIGGDPRIIIRTENGEIVLTSEGFARGLSIAISPFGVWEINILISHEEDGEYAAVGNPYRTESVMTVFRAVAKWIMEAREPRPPKVKYRFALFKKEISQT